MANAAEIVVQLKAALQEVDSVSTEIGTGIGNVASRIEEYKRQLAEAIANGVPVSELQPIVDGLTGEVAELKGHAAALAPLASDPNNPAPVEPPPPNA